MATVMTEDRQEATRAVMTHLRKLRSGKDKLAKGRELNWPIVVALDYELMTDALARMSAYHPPVILGVYYPSDQKLRLMVISPAEDKLPADADDVRQVLAYEGVTVGETLADVPSALGMRELVAA